MNDTESISALADALDGGAAVVVAMLPEGEPGSALVARLADEAEARIMGDLDRAVRTTRTLIEVSDRRSGEPVRARARRVHGQALTYANRYDEAIDVLAAALVHAERGRDEVEQGRIRLTMLHVHARRARYDEARSCGEEARSAFERAGQPVLAGRAHNNLGILERMRDRPREAITHFARAATLLANEPPLLAHVENNLAEALLDLDRFAEAEGAFGRALTAFRSAGAHRHAGIVLGNLADLASRQGRLHEALVHFEEARRTLGSAAAPGDAARLAVEQADVLMSLGLVSAAASGYEGAVATLDAHAMEAEAARGRLGLGRALARLNDPRAGTTLAQAAAAFAGKGNTTGHARTLAAQAEIAVGEGDLDEAARILDEARRATHDRPALEAWVDLLRTTVLSASDAARAETLAADAGTRAEAMGITPLAADLARARGKVLRTLGRGSDALASLRHAVALAERSRGALGADRFRAAFLGSRAGLWEDAASAALDVGKTEEAFAFTEMGRARTLLEFAGRHEPDPRDDDLSRDLAAVTGELAALYDRAHEGLGSGEARARVLDEIASRERRAEDLRLRLASSARHAGVFASPVTLRDLEASIPEDGSVVEYAVEQGTLSAFVVRRDGTRVFRGIAQVAAVEAALERFMFQVGRATARGIPTGERGARLAMDADAELGALAGLILTPIADALGGARRITVVPVGPVHGIALTALPWGVGRLMDAFELSVAPSASVLGRLGRGAGTRKGVALVGVADERVPRAEAEAHEAAAALRNAGVDGVTVMTGAAATRAAVAELARRVGHLHVAGHARFVASNPQASGLRLADGWMTASEIARLDLAGATVVLTGCDTGRGGEGEERSALGLSRAVLAAGAASLTVTLWAVHDATAATLLGRAYGGLEGSVGSGIRKAQRAMVAEAEGNGGRLHAAAWAPFVTVESLW